MKVITAAGIQDQGFTACYTYLQRGGSILSWWLSISFQSDSAKNKVKYLTQQFLMVPGETSEVLLVTRILDKSGAEMASTQPKQSINKGDSSVFLQHLTIALLQLCCKYRKSLFDHTDCE